MTTITSPVRLARPSAVATRALTDAERIAMQSPGISLVADPSERAHEFSGVYIRDRIGARVGAVKKGTPASIAGNQGFNFLGSSSPTGAVFNFVLPRSYFCAILVDIVDLTDTSSFVSADVNDPTKMFFGVLGNGTLRVQHGIENFISTPTSTVTSGRHVAWCSYDHTNGAAEVGLDSVTAAATGTIAAEHASDSKTWIWGSSAPVQGLNGIGGPAVVIDRPLLGQAESVRRLSVLAWLAEYGSVEVSE